jgi:hypothetical protein
VSSGVAATLVGLAGGLMARRALTPPLVVALAGITPLLPGLKVYRGLYALLNDELVIGANQLLAATGVGGALAAGVILGEWCDRTIRRPRILSRFGALRRPIVRRVRRHPRDTTRRDPSRNIPHRRRSAHPDTGLPGSKSAGPSLNYSDPAPSHPAVSEPDYSNTAHPSPERPRAPQD